MDYCFDILKSETALSSKHLAPGWPSLCECTCLLLTFVFKFELCTLRASHEPAPVQTTKKSGTKMPLTLQKAILAHSDYIPHIFNPCGDVTMLYLLWQLAKVLSFK